MWFPGRPEGPTSGRVVAAEARALTRSRPASRRWRLALQQSTAGAQPGCLCQWIGRRPLPSRQVHPLTRPTDGPSGRRTRNSVRWSTPTNAAISSPPLVGEQAVIEASRHAALSASAAHADGVAEVAEYLDTDGEHPDIRVGGGWPGRRRRIWLVREPPPLRLVHGGSPPLSSTSHAIATEGTGARRGVRPSLAGSRPASEHRRPPPGAHHRRGRP
jgi:hypothetical protein